MEARLVRGGVSHRFPLGKRRTAQHPVLGRDSPVAFKRGNYQIP